MATIKSGEVNRGDVNSMKIKIFEKIFFIAVLLLLSLFPLTGAESAVVALIILDTTPPVVIVTNPVNNTVINIFNNTISGTVTDNIGISQVNLSLNGSVLYTWGGAGAFKKEVNYTANTTAVITITASDTSNNTVSETVVVNIFPNTVSRTVTTIADVVETVDAKNETNTVINFTTVQDATGSINVTAGTSASVVGAVPMAGHGLAQYQQTIDKYLEINVSNGINATSGSVSWAIIAMYYSDADLDKDGSGNAGDLGDINESSLKFWWYCSNCPSESKWKVLETGDDYTPLGGPYVYEAGVSMPNNYVWANISRFSVYSIAGAVISTPAVSPTPVSPAPPKGGGMRMPRTHEVRGEQLSAGYARELFVHDRFKFAMENETHYVVLLKVTATTVTIGILSEVQQATLTVGELKKFEITGDEYYDLSVELNSIVGSKARLTIKEIHDLIALPPEEKEIVPPVPEEVIPEVPVEEVIPEVPPPIPLRLPLLASGILLAVLILILYKTKTRTEME